MESGAGRHTARVLGVLIGALAGLLALLLLVVWLLVNPNDYKGRIAQAVKDATGRELRLAGDIKLSLLPWVALELGPAQLGNPPGFDSGPFLAVQHAAVRVRLWPLLRRRLVIGRIDIDGLDLRLQKNAAGRGNWQGVEGAAQSPPAANGARPAASFEGLDGLGITHGRLSYQDLTLAGLTLQTGPVAQGRAVPVALSFDLTPGTGAGHLAVALKTQATLDMAAQRYRLEALDLSGTAALPTSGRSVTFKIGAPALTVDLGADTLALPAWDAQLAGVHVSGAVQAAHMTGTPAVSGSVRISPFDLREWLARLDVAVPATRDPKALTQFAAAADFSYDGAAARVGPLQLTLDETQLRGEAGVTQLKGPPAVHFDLAADRIDVDRYLPPAQAATSPVAPPAAPDAAAPAAHAAPLQATGTLAVGALQVAGIAVTNLKVTVNAAAGLTRLHPSEAQLYGGRYVGDISLDQRGAVPGVSLDAHLAGIDIAQLLADRFKSRRLSGRGNVDIKLSAHGAGADALLRSANGRIAADLANGAVEGVDVGYQIGLAQALIDKSAAPASANTGRTRFDSFKAAATLANGTATLETLNIGSAYLRISGGGQANLLTQALDLKVLASLLKGAAAPSAGPPRAARTAALVDIPVLITGSAADPKVRLDLQGLARTELKQQVQEQLKDKLTDTLKGLFER